MWMNQRQAEERYQTHKKVHTVWLYLYEALEKRNLIFSDGKQTSGEWGLTRTE